MGSSMFLLVTDIIWKLAEKNHLSQVKIIAPYSAHTNHLDTYPALLPPIMMIVSPSGTPQAPSSGGSMLAASREKLAPPKYVCLGYLGKGKVMTERQMKKQNFLLYYSTPSIEGVE